MTLNQIKMLREMYGTDDLFVFTSDAIFYDGKRQLCNLIWDDQNQILHVVRLNPSFRTNSINNKPIDVHSINYDIIEYVSLVYDTEEVEKVLDKLVSNNLIDSKKKKEIIDEFKTLLTY